MTKLDYYSNRSFRKVILGKNKPVELILPLDACIGESERLLEWEIALDKVKEYEETEDNVKKFFDIIYQQLLILFQRHNPELTLEELKDMMTKEEALDLATLFNRRGKKEEVSNKKKILQKLL